MASPLASDASPATGLGMLNAAWAGSSLPQVGLLTGAGRFPNKISNQLLVVVMQSRQAELKAIGKGHAHTRRPTLSGPLANLLE